MLMSLFCKALPKEKIAQECSALRQSSAEEVLAPGGQEDLQGRGGWGSLHPSEQLAVAASLH